MRRALALAASPGVPLGPNPRVGCVVIDPAGEVIAEAFHRGAGTPHAEVVALRDAGPAAVGATVVVTLEPCAHTGRTGPCAEALASSGVRRVVFGQRDPNPAAAGGAEVLRSSGVEVAAGAFAEEARALNRIWTFAMERGRPFVTWKYAATLDGRSAAADGTSRWITSPASRLDVHRLRGLCDTIMVGTNTVAVDDPELTVRDEFGEPLNRQPLRAVMGRRPLDPGHRVFDTAADTLLLETHDPAEALAALFARDRQHVFLEGGPTLAAAFLEAGLVDEVVAYLAPKLLGAGPAAIGDLGIGTIDAARTFTVVDVAVIGSDPDADVRLTLEPREQE
ncbi:MAG: bifunctional diaminohydroxyphosphoribosylaminopyrimidine deaminase/5-amino-6-(5-phosphoribosylamino)uracil reductase RibD [Nocardioides sp.]